MVPPLMMVYCFEIWARRWLDAVSISGADRSQAVT